MRKKGVIIMKALKPKPHGYIDYIYGALMFLLPSWLGFAGTTAATIFYVTGVAVVGLSLLTAYPLGAFKKVPFPVHGTIELIAGIFFLAAPWIFGFNGDETVRNTFLIVGAFVVGLWAVTDYKAAGATSVRYHFPDHKDRLAA